MNISEEEIVQTVINNFIEPVDEDVSLIEQFVADINEAYNLTIPLPQSANKIREIVISIKNQYGNDASLAVLGLYFLQNVDPLASLEKVKDFFQYFIDTHIKNIITPTARVTLALSAAIEFPQSIIKPANPDGTPYVPSTVKSQFRFAQALLYADTQLGVGFQLELGGSLYPCKLPQK